MFRRSALLLPLMALVIAVPARSRAADDDVTIYRCTDARGHVTLRDTPCTGHEQQQTRTMLRPKDAPAEEVRRARTAPAPPPVTAAPTRVVVLSPPRPLFECVTPDGDRYTSESDQGNPRWVPLWTLYPMVPARPGMVGGSQLAITSGNVHLQAGNTVIQPPLAVPGYAYGAGTWVRDACHALPQAEVCERLRDRRERIDHRFFNAMPSERDTLRVEERGINARLDNDCGGH